MQYKYDGIIWAMVLLELNVKQMNEDSLNYW